MQEYPNFKFKCTKNFYMNKDASLDGHCEMLAWKAGKTYEFSIYNTTSTKLLFIGQDELSPQDTLDHHMSLELMLKYFEIPEAVLILYFKEDKDAKI